MKPSSVSLSLTRMPCAPKVKYDPAQNILLKRNALVIKRARWEPPFSFKNQQKNTIETFSAKPSAEPSSIKQLL